MNALAQLPTLEATIINDQITVSTLAIARFTNKLHYRVLRKLDSYNEKRENLNHSKIGVATQYIDNKGETRICYEMPKNQAIAFMGTFTGEAGISANEYFIQEISRLENIIKSKSKEDLKLIKKYRLTDTADCSSMSLICGRWEITTQQAHDILCTQGILKRVRHGKNVLYRLTANYLGHGFANIDQDVNDLLTHLKWTDDKGIAFLTDFFERYFAKIEAERRLAELAKQPTLFCLD